MLRIEAHLPDAHANLAEGLGIELTALGDFEGSVSTSKIAPGDSRGLPLPFPGATRAVSALGESGAEDLLGLGSAAEDGNIDVLLWRAKDATRLSGEGFAPEPAGLSLGLDARRRHLLAAGSSVDTADAGRAFTVDLGTGRTREVEGGMLPARAFASVTSFGEDSMLVAGGVDPTLGSAGPLASASVFHVGEAHFDRANVVTLAQPRSRHGAVVLVSGETLLIGGEGPSGAPLATLEAVSPADRSARIAGLATLSQPRAKPVVLRLDDDSVFVGGGSAGGAPVGVLEWLTPDASKATRIRENLVLAESHGFAAMPGGGVLGVGVCVPEGAGSCTGDLPKKSVVWFREDGSADVLPALPFAPSRVALIAAGQGAPWLFAVGPSGPVYRRFDPWTGVFDEPESFPKLGPDADLAAPLGVDAGAFVWLERDAGAALSGFRHDVRGTYSRDVAPLLLSGREHVAPSRLPSGVSKSGIEYSASGLGLRGDGALAVVADTSYAAVDLALTLTSGPPPLVMLGAVACAWPSLDDAVPGETVDVRRRGAEVTLERGGTRQSCAVGEGRLGVALAAQGSRTSFVRALEIRRR